MCVSTLYSTYNWFTVQLSRLREVRKENARLKTKLQGQAVRPSSGTASKIESAISKGTTLLLVRLAKKGIHQWDLENPRGQSQCIGLYT